MVEVTINFDSHGNRKLFQTSGWGIVEEHGSWTVGLDSQIIIPGLPTNDTHSVSIWMFPFISPPKLTFQSLLIYANEFAVHAQQILEDCKISFDIPQQAMKESGDVELTFHCPTATSPSSISDGGDVRQLGVSVSRIVITGRPLDSDKPVNSIIETQTISTKISVITSPKVAAVTMVYNESEYLPIWLKHYSQQIGIENCFIIDHGSNDGSTSNLVGCNVLRIPRSPYDPVKQTSFNSQFCSSLLSWFDWIIYSDVDELLMADPSFASNLVEYCSCPLPPVVTAIGLNVAHRLEIEDDLDFSKPILEQRHYVFTAASMCKPLLTKTAIVWSPGCHSSNAAVAFDQLYSFHLRWFDLSYGMRRLNKTRSMDWGRLDAGSHQRVEDEQMENLFKGFSNLIPLDNIDFNPGIQPVAGFLGKIAASQIGRENNIYKIDLDIWADNLWKIPERFVGAF